MWKWIYGIDSISVHRSYVYNRDISSIHPVSSNPFVIDFCVWDSFTATFRYIKRSDTQYLDVLMDVLISMTRIQFENLS